MEIRAILFDMDGLVLDTERLYTRFWQEAAQALGFPMTKAQALGMRSLNREAGAARLRSYFGEKVSYEEVRKERIRRMDAFVKENGVETKPGIRELLSFAQKNGIKTAITTSSPLERTQCYLEKVGLSDSFDRVFSGYMVERGKPEPDLYLYAAEQLAEKTEHCMVLEDSPAGILAAYRAGCIPVMIPDQDEPEEETKKLLYACVKRLDLVPKLWEK